MPVAPPPVTQSGPVPVPKPPVVGSLPSVELPLPVGLLGRPGPGIDGVLTPPVGSGVVLGAGTVTSGTDGVTVGVGTDTDGSAGVAGAGSPPTAAAGRACAPTATTHVATAAMSIARGVRVPYSFAVGTPWQTKRER